MTYKDDLQTRRDAVAAELAALTTAKAGGLPNSTATGVDHQAYKAGLYAELERLDKLIKAAQDDEDGPIEYTSIGTT